MEKERKKKAKRNNGITKILIYNSEKAPTPLYKDKAIDA